MAGVSSARLCVCVCVCMSTPSMRVCVCVYEHSQHVCVCVCVCVFEHTRPLRGRLPPALNLTRSGAQGG